MVPVTFKKRGEIRTEVLVEEGQRGEVAAQAEELGHHHEPVPGADGQRHHQQLGQDERREGDGHHVHELRLKQHQRAVHEDATWWRPRETKHATWTTGQKPLFFSIFFFNSLPRSVSCTLKDASQETLAFQQTRC